MCLGVPGQIVEQAWTSHILHAELDPTLTQLFAIMTPAVMMMRQGTGGPVFTPAHSRLYDPIRTTFANAAEILGLPVPDLFVGDPNSTRPFGAAAHPFGGILLNVPAVEARADSLVYAIGKRVAEQRRELLARAFFSAATDLTGLVGTAACVSPAENGSG